MKNISTLTAKMGYLFLLIGFILVTAAWIIESKTNHKAEANKPVIILPNDLSLISKYDGDPSLLSAYTRNDSLFLNFEGY